MSKRENMRINPSHKHFHSYQNFSGGLNTVDADEKIGDSELANIQNVDIGERGSLKRRNGFIPHLDIPEGEAQGFFRYFKEGSGYEEIVAISGKLYKDGVELTIDGLDQFQTERQIEAVQFRDKLFIATGTKLVDYDGTVAKVVDPYAPQPLEALYIGTNGLADNPTNFMQDGEATFLRIDGVTFSKRYGIVNQTVTLTAYVSKPAGTTIQYKFEHKMKHELNYKVLQDWSATKTFDFSTTVEGEHQFRVLARVSGTTDEKPFLVPKYRVKPVQNPDDLDVPDSTIQTCNRILLHWNRLIIYGDINQPDAIFISHLNNPAYFPTPNSLVFESEQRDRITSIVRFRDMLVIFTPTSIQALYGKSPMDYQRLMLNSSIGCIAPYSTAIVGNYISFLSNEGVQVLKSIGYNETRMNVEKIDTKISNLIPHDENACGLVFDNQYHLVSGDERFRFYYERGVWTKDKSPMINFSRMYTWNGEMYGQRQNGQIIRFSSNVFDDVGYIFEDVIETKRYDFSEPYHQKKLKEMQLVMNNQNQRTEISTYVYADAAEILGTDTSHATVNEQGEVVWVYESNPNLDVYSGTELGKWEMGNSPFGEVGTEVYKTRLAGRGRKVKVILTHKDNTPIQLLGVGLKFKVKRP